MKKFITMILRHWARTPFKISITLVAVALGTGILILSLSAGTILSEEVSAQLEKNGVILYVANGEWGTDGSISQNRPAEWDSNAPSITVSDVDTVKNAAVVATPPFNEITAEGKSYTLRSAVGSNTEYLDIFSLNIISGVAMTSTDLEMGLKKVWISEEMAVILYGSAENALGKWIQPPGNLLHRGPGGRNQQNMIINYFVTGVFETPGEVARRSYGIGDLVFPYTSFMTAGKNTKMMMDMMAGTFVVKSDGSSAEKVSASIKHVLSVNYGDDIDILVWEGSPGGISTYMEELRQAVKMFTISVNLLGIVLLIISSLGIFSIMVVEALSRRRDIALERSLGASQIVVVGEFWTWSLALSLTGAVAGIILAFIFSKPVLNSLSPLVGEISDRFMESSGIKPGALLLSVVMALGFGGVLGILPALSAVKGNIADTIREV